jgi:hypothetical protein
MKDVFAELKSFKSVREVHRLYPYHAEKRLDCFFFICPKMKGAGLRVNRNTTGFTARYSSEPAPTTNERFNRVKAFIDEATTVSIEISVTAVFASADALILYPIPFEPPPAPQLNELEVVSNHELVNDALGDFWRIYDEQPWKKISPKITNAETERIRTLLPASAPDNLKRDYIERVWSGFALDGILAHRGAFGANPVLLAVEGRDVAILQNAALPKEDRLPVVELR